jgi:predicted nucleotidyltransferase
MAFQKLFAKQVSAKHALQLVSLERSRILSECNPKWVYLIGSASRGEMTDASDLDFVVILHDLDAKKEIKKRFYSSVFERTVPVDVLFFFESEYVSKSKVGGICMICSEEGKLLYYDERVTLY